MKTFIGLGGLAGSGKSTVARALAVELAKIEMTNVKISFAEPMRDMMSELLIAAEGIRRIDAQIILHEEKTVPRSSLGGNTIRRAMQTLGTEWGRDCLSPTIWTDIAEDRARRTRADVVIFDDVRFATEAEMIERNNGVVYVLERDGVGPLHTDHASEAMQYRFKVRVRNNNLPADAARLILQQEGLA